MSVEIIKKFSDADLDGFVANFMESYRKQELDSVAFYYRLHTGEPRLFLWSLDPVAVSGQLELLKTGFLAEALEDCLIDDE